MKKQWFALVLIVALMAICAPAEAQVPVYNTNGTVAYGIPAQPYHGNGQDRHLVNGYRGVNPRHYSRLPMSWGTGPIMATGPIVVHRPMYQRAYYPGAYGRPCGGYVRGVYPAGRYHVSVGYAGPGYYIGGTVGW